MNPDRQLPMIKRKWLLGAAAARPDRLALLVRGIWTGGRRQRRRGRNGRASFRSRSRGRNASRSRSESNRSATSRRFPAWRMKSRVETTIIAVHFDDGAKVKRAICCSRSMARQIDAQIEQAEGASLAGPRQLEGAQRDLRRYTDLVAKGATTHGQCSTTPRPGGRADRPPSRPTRRRSKI